MGNKGDVLHWGEGPEVVMRERAENDLVVGTLTSTTYLFIVLVLLIGVILGDTGKYTVSSSVFDHFQHAFWQCV